MPREAKNTPPRLVEAGHVVEFGHFRDEFRDLNIGDADVFGLGPLARFANPFRLKEWQHFAVFNDEAHHVHDERMAWFKSIQDIHHRMLQRDGALALQVDVTATPKHDSNPSTPTTAASNAPTSVLLPR